MASRYGVSRSAGKRAIIGTSFGAKDALDAAFSSGGAAEGLGRLGLLIPGRRIGRADIDAIAERRNLHLRVAILAGQYDQANVATARNVRQTLADAGHSVDYTEVPEGHSAVTWTNHLRVMLVSLFGVSGRPSSDGEVGKGQRRNRPGPCPVTIPRRAPCAPDSGSNRTGSAGVLHALPFSLGGRRSASSLWSFVGWPGERTRQATQASPIIEGVCRGLTQPRGPPRSRWFRRSQRSSLSG
jgi:hypothetical protein